jgi:hypothetical protein
MGGWALLGENVEDYRHSLQRTRTLYLGAFVGFGFD